MARAKRKDSYFTIATNNISPYVNSIEFSNEAEMLDITCLGAEARDFDSGLTNCTINLAGVWDDTATVGSYTVLAALVGSETSSAFEYGPEGNTSGMVKYSGSIYVSNYTESGEVGGMVMFAATLQVAGALTVGTFGA